MSVQGERNVMRCAHDVCTCLVTTGEKFCSEACGPGMSSEPYCGCAHTECESAPPVAKPPLD